MTGTPWCLDTLGLPAHADTVAVRRAYAARLRQVDPGADPVAFQQLREAYQAALAWCNDHPAGPAPGQDDGWCEETRGAADDDAAADTPPQDHAAEDAMRRLRDAVRDAGDDAIAALLGNALASLRHGYVDAPGQFEDLVIDALATAGIDRRAALFHAATEAFHWHEVGRLRRADPRAAWIGRVLAQAEDWATLDAGWRATWLAHIERAQGGIDAYVARRWPDIGRLRAWLPDWLALYLVDEQLDAWQAAFENLPRDTRDEFERRAAPPSASVPRRGPPARPRRRLGMPPLAWAALWFVLMLFYLITNGISTVRQHGQGEPLPNFGESALSPRECMALYAQFDKPDAFTGMRPDDVVQAKRRAQRCALDGHWRAPGGVNSPPPH
ncbi:hypothetical protein [Luteibacter yeojuensis]|uniref:J domain-containing protein n=1 Tax=Luteibacter yeojuensis TaxID=345309 RepID=A0A0F3L2B9_9GAMM|nr:hypothetical protein [Luteibacter yeojuensis]KJV37382.1 hypothetical protein VI08_00805 [Luteibacter yeojuensis]